MILMHKWRIIRLTLGTILIPLGIAGLLVPGLPGWPLLLLGALLLSLDIPWFNRFICWLENKFPPTTEKFEEIRRFFKEDGEKKPPCPPRDRPPE